MQEFDPAAGAGPCFAQANPVCGLPGYASATAALFRGLLRLDGLPIGACVFCSPVDVHISASGVGLDWID